MDVLSNIKSPIEKELEAFLVFYSSLFKSDNPYLQEILTYISNNRGKMVRPLLVILVAKSLGAVNVSTYRAAAAVELLHNASLLHDDVVDDSGIRHHVASVNAAFNNKVAVLTGDYLLSSALHLVTLTENISIVQTISELGVQLAKGEVLQLSNTYRASLSKSLYFDVIRQKTASFFSSCAAIGAMSAGASDAVIEQFSSFGEYIGLGFQIRDDIFDYYDGQKIGKPTGNDLLEGKITLPAIYALTTYPDEKAQSLVAKLKDDELSPDEIDYLIEFTKSHNGIDYAKNTLKELREKAIEVLPDSIASSFKDSLVSYLDYLFLRDK